MRTWLTSTKVTEDKNLLVIQTIQAQQAVKNNGGSIMAWAACHSDLSLDNYLFKNIYLHPGANWLSLSYMSSSLSSAVAQTRCSKMNTESASL